MGRGIGNDRESWRESDGRKIEREEVEIEGGGAEKLKPKYIYCDSPTASIKIQLTQNTRKTHLDQ